MAGSNSMEGGASLSPKCPADDSSTKSHGNERRSPCRRSFSLSLATACFKGLPGLIAARTKPPARLTCPFGTCRMLLRPLWSSKTATAEHKPPRRRRAKCCSPELRALSQASSTPRLCTMSSGANTLFDYSVLSRFLGGVEEAAFVALRAS